MAVGKMQYSTALYFSQKRFIFTWIGYASWISCVIFLSSENVYFVIPI